MNHLNDHSANPPKRVSSGLSSNFKSTSRDKKASWGNRFVHDHNDLFYQADPYSIGSRLKSNSKRHTPKPQNPQQGFSTKKYQYSPLKQRQISKTSQSQRMLNKGIDVQRYIKQVDYAERMKKVNETAATSHRTRFMDEREGAEVEPFSERTAGKEKAERGKKVIWRRIEEIAEDVVAPAATSSRPVNHLGLSEFQYAATIQGKILSKSNHHLDLQRDKTKRTNNTIKHWYNPSKNIEKPQSILEREKMHSLEKYHSFKSDSAHQLFQGTKRMLEDNGCGYGGMLDKFYEPGPYDINHFRITKDLVDYIAMTTRPELPLKLGTNLSYKTDDDLTMGVKSNKRPIMQLAQSPRRLIFSRQVISPSRGCNR